MMLAKHFMPLSLRLWPLAPDSYPHQAPVPKPFLQDSLL